MKKKKKNKGFLDKGVISKRVTKRKRPTLKLGM